MKLTNPINLQNLNDQVVKANGYNDDHSKKSGEGLQMIHDVCKLGMQFNMLAANLLVSIAVDVRNMANHKSFKD